MIDAELLVVGAGPAGMAAAIFAARYGRQVILLDDNPAAGGQIWRNGLASSSEPLDKVKHAMLRDLALSGVDLRTGWRVFDAPAPRALRAIHADKVETFAYGQLILATGARERFLPFPGWTLPGVFGVGGLQALVKGGLPIERKRVAIAGSGPLLLAAAAYLQKNGASVISVAEQAPLSQLLPLAGSLALDPMKLWQAANYRRTLGATSYRTGCWPVAALGVNGVTGIRLADGHTTWEESCDCIACGFHLVPNTELAALLGCAFDGDFVAVDDSQRTSLDCVYCAGEPAGIAGLDNAIVQGKIAGLSSAGQDMKAHSLRRRLRAARRFGERLDSAFRLREELRALAQPDCIVCRCEDVRYSGLAGCASWTEAKLQTRCGMGPCQGRICGPATRVLFGWEAGSVRPPLFPVPLSAFCPDSSITTVSLIP